MGNEQQSLEPFERKSQQADVSRYADPPAETVVPNIPPSTCDGDSTVLGDKQSLQPTIDAPVFAADSVRPKTNGTGIRYRILKPHARGGLGEVFVARDEELNRDVALKEIRGEHAHKRDSRGRFLLEAEITGGLEHPGIVPVYGLGQYADGRPYYAMRFIQGDSLKEAIQNYHSEQAASATHSERTLQLRKLLGRFVDVCQAVSYAHSRGVLHRDLKPGNIMLGKYGETLVVDWGLAKVQGRDDASAADADHRLQPTSGDGVTPTLAGSALGTPAYMPPEQAAGKLDQLGPASDVYSLGATLYHLLTGQAPFKANTTEEVLQAVQSGTFPRPTEINGSVPKPLEAVCLKAMSLKPRDRYASPQDLADDIERYLADEPVQAFPEPFPQRAKRWVRKHPTLTTTTAAVVLLSAVGLGTFSSILGAKNSQLSTLNGQLQTSNSNLTAANTALDQANADLTAANSREVEARELAQTNEQAAREQSQLALSTLTSVIDDVQRGFEDVPGGSGVRRLLLTTSLEKLEHVAIEYVHQSTIDRNTLAALMDMGDVVLRFGTGEEDTNLSPMTAAESTDLENQATAVELAEIFYLRAHEIAQSLAGGNPDDADAWRILSLTVARVGNVSLQLGKTVDAQSHFRRYNEICEKLVAADPTNFEFQRDLAVSYEKLAETSLQLGDTPDALVMYGRMIDILHRLAEANPNNADAQRDLAISYEKLGDVWLQLGDIVQAYGFYEKGLDATERLVAVDPSNVRVQRDVAIAYSNIAGLSLQLGDSAAAVDFYQRSHAILERLATDDSTSNESQRDLMISYTNLGRISLELGIIHEAREYFEQSLKIGEALMAKDPTSALLRLDLSVRFDNLGDVSMRVGDAEAARQFYDQALDIREKLALENQGDVQAQRDLSISYERLGNVCFELGDVVSAEEFYQQGLVIRRTLADEDPSNTQSLRDLSISFERLGDAQRQLGNPESARDFYQEGLDVRNVIARLDPSNLQAQEDLSVLYERLGDLSFELGETPSAHELYQQAKDIHERLVEADPNNAMSLRNLSISHGNLGLTFAAALEFDYAIEHYTESIRILDELVDSGRIIDLARSDRAFWQLELQRVQREAASVRAALADWETFISRPGARSRLSQRIQALARTGRFDEIPQSAEMLRSLDAENFDNLYNAACGYALCANAIAPAEGEELAPEQQIQRQQYIDLALACLRESIAAGWSDFDHMQQDPDLAVLHELPEFEDLLHTPPVPSLPE